MIPSLSAALSTSHFLSSSPIKQCESSCQTAPTPTLAAIIRGGAVLSPVSSTRPWISRASAGPCRPLSLTLTLLSLPHYTSLTLTPLHTPLCLPWPSGLCSCCPIIQPVTPLLLLQLKLPSPTLDLAPGLSPFGPCASVAPSMDGPILGQGVAPCGTPVQNTSYKL